MPKDKKTTSECVLYVLIDHKTMLLSDITKLVSKSVGKEVKIQNISSIMTRLSNLRQYQIGHFIDNNIPWCMRSMNGL